MKAAILLAAALLLAAIDIVQAAKHYKEQTYGHPLIRIRTSCFEGDARHAIGNCCSPSQNLDAVQRTMVDEMKVLFETYEGALAGLQRTADSKQEIDPATALMIQGARERVESARARFKSKVWDDDNLQDLQGETKEDYRKAGAFMKAATPGLAKAESQEHAEERAEAEAASTLRRQEKAKSLASGVALADIPAVGKMDLGKEHQSPAGIGRAQYRHNVEKRDEQRGNLAALREASRDDQPQRRVGAYSPGVAQGPAPSGGPPRFEPPPLVEQVVGLVRAKGGFRRVAPGSEVSGDPVDEEEQAANGKPQAPPGEVEKRVRNAWDLVLAGDYAAAEAEAKRALELDPKNAAALEVLALAQLKQGKYDEAMRTATAAIELDPNRANVFALRAYAKELMGNRLGSLMDIEAAARLDPRYAEKYRIAKAGGRIYDPNDPDPFNLERRRSFGAYLPTLFALLALLAVLGGVAWRMRRPSVLGARGVRAA